MAQPYARLYDGTNQIVFQDGGTIQTYQLLKHSWMPAIAGLRPSRISGRGLFQEVAETLEIEVRGATAAAAYANLAALDRMLRRAERHWLGEVGAPAVTFEVSPGGGTVSSSATPLRALVLGPTTENNTGSGLGLTMRWEEATYNFVIRGVRVSFVRQGDYKHGAGSTQSSAATNNGSIATVSGLTAVDNPSPYTIQLTNFWSGNNPAPDAPWTAYIITTGDSADIVFNTESGAFPNGAAAFTYINESANHARNTTTVRYTPTGTGEAGWGSVKSFSLPAGRWALFINARNNSTTVSYSVRVTLYDANSSAAVDRYLVSVQADIGPGAASPFPLWRMVGIVSIPVACNATVWVAASATGSTLDIDALCAVKLDGDANIIELHRSIIASIPSANTATINHRLLTDPTGQALVGSGQPTGHSGNLAPYSDNGTLYCLLLGTGGNADNNWRQENTGGGVQQNTWTLVRTAAYTVQQ